MKKGELTRRRILEQAFKLIYKNGYQATSIDNIVENPFPVGKGSFFYHFEKKEELGLAVIEEIIYPSLDKALITPLEGSEDPLADMYTLIKKFLLSASSEQINYGCPTNNLIQEMAPLNESFRNALKKILDRWQKVIVEALERAKKMGKVKADIDSASVAEFIVVGYEGLRGLGKVYQNIEFYQVYLKQLKYYLESLR